MGVYIKRKLRERGGPIVGGPQWDVETWTTQAMAASRDVYLDSALGTPLAQPLHANSGWQYLTTAEVLPADTLIDLEDDSDINVGDVFQLVDGAFVAILTVKTVNPGAVANRIEVVAAPGGAHTFAVGSTAGDPDNYGDIAFYADSSLDLWLTVTKQGAATPSVPVQIVVGVTTAPADASYVTTTTEAGLSNEQVLGTAVIMEGTLAGRPAAGTNGRLYVTTDETGGRIAYRDTGATWNKIAFPASATHALLAGVGANDHHNQAHALTSSDHDGQGQYEVAVKSADESVTNSTTMQDDDHLTVPVAANQRYMFELVLHVIPDDTTCGFKWLFSFPAAASGFYIGHRRQADDALGSASSDFFAARAIENECGGGIAFTADGMVHIITGSLTTGANAGNLLLRWAQTAANGAGIKTTLKAGSWMRLQRVS